MSKPLVQATGRRKRAVARVSVRAGSGKITINGRTLEEYIPSELLRMIATEPLEAHRNLGNLRHRRHHGRRWHLRPGWCPSSRYRPCID